MQRGARAMEDAKAQAVMLGLLVIIIICAAIYIW
jgi:hypothetical protein